MPTYEYACRDCGDHLEVVQSMEDDALEICPSCDGELRKVFNPAGIIFKGSGWHIKDYGTGSSNTAERPPAEGGDGDGGAAASDDGGGTAGDGDGGSSETAEQTA